LEHHLKAKNVQKTVLGLPMAKSSRDRGWDKPGKANPMYQNFPKGYRSLFK